MNQGYFSILDFESILVRILAVTLVLPTKVILKFSWLGASSGSGLFLAIRGNRIVSQGPTCNETETLVLLVPLVLILVGLPIMKC